MKVGPYCISACSVSARCTPLEVGEEATLLIIFNPWHDLVRFKLPEATGGEGWKLLADTNHPDSQEEPHFSFGHEYEVTARSLLLFGLK